MSSTSQPSTTAGSQFPGVPPPSNSLVTPLLTDLYQITMTYAHWKTGRHTEEAVFELFFRKNPFSGEYTIFCGLDEVLKHLASFRFTDDDIAYLRSTPSLKGCKEEFWVYLRNLTCQDVVVEAMKEGSVAFPRVPLIIVRGPLGIAQLLETTLLTLTNYPSLIATNAARMVLAAQEKDLPSGTGPQASATSTSAGDDRMQHPSPAKQHQRATRRSSHDNQYLMEGKLPRQCLVEPKCVEFGLRRAQGPDGGFSASKYSSVGGFVGTSNVQAGKLLGLNIVGTHAHSFVQAFGSLDEVQDLELSDATGGDNKTVDMLESCLEKKRELGYTNTNDGELAAFIAYAYAFPNSFLCLVDTYDTLHSGVRNFIIVACVLIDLGYRPRGIRLDSGDLAYLSLECARLFGQVAALSPSYACFEELDIVASNDINEEVLTSLNKQGHAITLFGIGTNLVTCQKQPALGCVYKLVELNGQPRIKLSQELEKVLIPGRKKCYRIFGTAGWALLDFMMRADETEDDDNSLPSTGKRILCRHPFMEQKRAAVTPAKVVPLHSVVFAHGKPQSELPKLEETAQFVSEQLKTLRPDVLRQTNPTPYKVSVSSMLFTFLHDMWQEETPVAELS